MTRLAVLLALTLACILAIPFTSIAQVPTGIPDFGTYDADGVATINLAYLNVHLELPLRSSTARHLPLPLSLTMDSSINVNGGIYTPSGPWIVGSPIPERLDSVFSQATCNNQRDAQYTISGMMDGHRTNHSLGANSFSISQNGCPNPSSGSGTTVDGWTIYASVSSSGLTGSAVDPQGNVYVAPGVNPNGSVTDANGNQLTWNGTIYADASGNALLSVTSGTPTTTYSYTGPGGTQESYTLTYTSSTVVSNFGCPGEQKYSTPGVLTNLALPDGSFYSFSYEPTVGVSGAVTGRLASITLPTGGTITYSYSGGTNGINCSDGSAAVITKTTPDGTWTYNHSISNGQGTTKVTDPYANYVVYTFAGQVEVQRIAYTSTGAVLGKMITCYNGNFTSCTTSTFVAQPISQKDVYYYPGTSASPSLVETKYSTNVADQDLVTQVTRYDFGATFPPGSNFVEQTTITYGSWNGSTCSPVPNILADVCTSVAKNTSGQVLQARYNSYDAHGNLTTQKDLTGGSSYLTKSFSYYTTGLVDVATDVNGATTTHTYGDCNSSFPTSILYQPTGLTTGQAWDCTGEVPLTSTDANGKLTQYDYTGDPFWRVVAVTDPLTNVLYTGYGPFFAGSEEAYADNYVCISGCASSIADHLTNFDSLGRVQTTQKAQAPAPPILKLRHNFLHVRRERTPNSPW